MTTLRHLALTIFIVILAGAGAAPAIAGEYPVHACVPGAGDVNNSWNASGNHGGVLAYENCPPTGGNSSWHHGLVTRATTVPSNPHATIPTGAYAALTFRAPPGAALSRISYAHTLCGWSGFRAGLVNDAGAWLRYAGPHTCGTYDPPQFAIPLGGTPAVHIKTQCVAGPCHVGSSTPMAWATLRSATVWVADHTAPAVSMTVAGGWRRGIVGVDVAASDNVGIETIDVVLGGRRAVTHRNGCDYSLPVPCTGFGGRLFVDTRGVGDGRHMLEVRARDSAGNWGSYRRAISVDNSAPTAPLNLRVAGGEAWRRTNSYSLSWLNPTQTARAPIKSADLAVCPATNGPESWSGCSRRTTAEPGVRSASSLKVPRPGEWVARVSLRDAAGNHDARSYQAVRLRLDDTPPSLAFEEQDPMDPGRVEVVAADSVSPLTRAEVELRRRGTVVWSALATTRTPTGFSTYVDDEHLGDGRYELRARAFDSAGNERSTDRDVVGAIATRTVPLRINTRLVAGQVRRVAARRSKGGKRRTRRIIVARPRVRYGRTIPIRGRLTTPGANPVANASVEVWERRAVPGSTWARVAMIGTDDDGRFRFKALRGPSRLLRFRYPGTSLVRARTTEVVLRVMAGATIRSNRSRVVNGDEVLLRGRVLGRPIPPAGKLVQLQAFSRGRWLTFATPRANPSSGRWRYRYRFTATRGTVRYRFRVQVPKESSYPYGVGASRPVRVTVRGL